MASSARTVPAAAVGLVPLVLVPALGVAQGGYLPDTWVWATPLAAWAAALAALFGGCGAVRAEWPWALAALGLTAWTGASALWSELPSQSLLEARRAVLYATVVLALLALAQRGAARALVLATHAAISLLLAYALARYLLGSRPFDPFEGRLLSQPIGYANGVGILAAAGLLLGAGLAARAPAGSGRAAVAASLPPLALALSLTASRGSWGALAAGGLVLVALDRGGRLLGAAAVALPGAALLVGLGAGLHLDAAGSAPSRAAGLALAAVTVAVAAVTALAGRGPVRVPTWAPSRRTSLALLAAAAAAAGATVALAGRTEPRSLYWHLAWRHEVAAHPGLGTGAGTFGLAWARSGLAPIGGGALDAHSLYLETLAELGPAGLLLLTLLLLWPVHRAIRRRPDGHAAAAAAAYAALLVHFGLDWDWELPAVTVAALACGAALLLGDAEPRPRATPALRAAVAATSLVLGAIGIAGAASSTVPAAAERTRAPRGGALVVPSGDEAVRQGVP